MKKCLLFLTIVLLFAACKPVDPVRGLAEYTDVVVYSYDSQSNTGCLTDYATVTVQNDLTSGYCMLDLTDIKLADNMAVRSARVGGLEQLLAEEFNDHGEVVRYNYTFFKTQGQAGTTGDLSVFDLRFGWLSTTFWGSFASDSYRYKLWLLPRQVQMYANSNTCVNLRGDSIRENAIHPRYDLEINTGAKTVSLRGSGLMFPFSEPTGEFFDIRRINMANLPMEPTADGFIARADKFTPLQTDADYEITDFTLRFDADFDGQRLATYTIRRLSDNETIRINSQFDYYRKE